MGYHTDFFGRFKLSHPLSDAHRVYLTKFSQTRRMKRDPTVASNLQDPDRNAVGLPLGEDAGYFVGGTGFAGQDKDDSVLDYNKHPEGQPGLWCQWIPSSDGMYIVWDEGEKFYDYVEWLVYIVNHFLKPWGYTLSGKCSWRGEDDGDVGLIIVHNNVVECRDIFGLACHVTRQHHIF